jgi:hypothetical protein
MRKAIGIGSFGAIAVVAMFLLSSIPMATACDYAWSAEYSLKAGKKEIGATVTVWHDIDYLYVKYTTTGDWYLTETHVAISIQKECPLNQNPVSIPVKNGNPPPGQFPYKTNHPAGTQTYTYKISLGENFPWGNYICIATHAVVKQIINGATVQDQTGWAGDHDFTGKNWATFFCYRPSPYKHVIIPGGQASITGNKVYTAGPGYWSVTLSGTNDNKWNHGGYSGWCLEEGQYWNGPIVNVQLVSSYDWAVLDAMQFNNHIIPHANWAAINWILNNHQGYSNEDMQEAIWALAGSSTTSGAAETLRTNALTHPFYAPPLGGDMAIVCRLPNTDTPYYNSQDIIIVVDP